jgi:hypothetical protein
MKSSYLIVMPWVENTVISTAFITRLIRCTPHQLDIIATALTADMSHDAITAGAGWRSVGAGRLVTTFFPDDGSSPVLCDDRVLHDKNNVVVTYHNPLGRTYWP